MDQTAPPNFKIILFVYNDHTNSSWVIILMITPI